MASRALRTAVVFLLVSLTFAARIEADPVAVTSGEFRLNAHDTPRFVFRGDEFVLPGVLIDIPAGIFPFEDCLFCRAGDSIRLGSDIQSNDLGQTAVTPAQFNGRTYDPATERLYYSGAMQFQSSTVTVPQGSTELFLILEQPFTFTASLMAFLSPARTGAPAFTANLTGSGTVTFTIFPNEAGDYHFADLLYSFDTVSPVPEPGTIALIGSGLVGLLARHRRRRRV
jgi:PEP-CTERM motif